MKKLCLLLCLSLSLPVFAAGNAEAGKAKSATCAACHGVDGNSMLDMYPAIAGQHEGYLVKQLKEFKLGSTSGGAEGRYDPVMSGMAAPLSEEDMQDLAAYFSSQKGREGSAPEEVIAKAEKLYRGGDLSRGVTACAACHGPKGNGMGLADFPDISGQHTAYIKKQLMDFRAGKRANDMNGMMRDVAMRLTDEDIELLSKYIAGLY
ncbi:c-type cytochrome [Aliiglaciecola sp. CAU 1673]|uniref:c-type cytochrome n=1 Tax=Aliiglaciecola sp. CAU 1673 TaxID=3032595 RepID=UPI0023DCDC82|nr:c-type cytochrome [Aliiglaciecola sp. CAU 1673]MDF2179742.1 c-type cytochrome [Aliiglaciecola sp. CAU 1673]